MTITITKTYEDRVTLTPPIFWQNKSRGEVATEMIGFVDEQTQMRLFITDSYTNVTNTVPTPADLSMAHNKWQPITEEEFFAALATAVERVSLTPVLTEKL